MAEHPEIWDPIQVTQPGARSTVSGQTARSDPADAAAVDSTGGSVDFSELALQPVQVPQVLRLEPRHLGSTISTTCITSETSGAGDHAMALPGCDAGTQVIGAASASQPSAVDGSEVSDQAARDLPMAMPAGTAAETSTIAAPELKASPNEPQTLHLATPAGYGKSLRGEPVKRAASAQAASRPAQPQPRCSKSSSSKGTGILAKVSLESSSSESALEATKGSEYKAAYPKLSKTSHTSRHHSVPAAAKARPQAATSGGFPAFPLLDFCILDFWIFSCLFLCCCLFVVALWVVVVCFSL